MDLNELTEEEKEILAKARVILRKLSTPKRAAASRANGAKGGRPRKPKEEQKQSNSES